MGEVELRQRVRELLAEFPRREGAWRVLATNLIPLAGFVLFGWSFLLAMVMVYVEAIILVFAVMAVLAVHVVQEQHPPPRRLASMPRLVVKGIGLWLVGGLIANVFTLAGAFILMQVLGARWSMVVAEVASDRAVLYGLAGFLVLHAVGVVERLRRPDQQTVSEEAVGDFRVVLLRSFFFPLFGGLLIQLFGLLGRFGAALVLLLLALVITAGDVYRREWLELFDEDAAPAGEPPREP